jgi:hypothetical protein
VADFSEEFLKFLEIAQAIFELNLSPYKYPNNLIPVILPATPPLNMEQSVPKHQHTKFRYWEINQKKEYNIL